MPGPFDRTIAGQSDLERALSDRSTRVELAPPARLASLQLTPEEGFLLSRIDRPTSVADLLLVSGLPEDRALVILLSCLTKGAVIVSGTTPKAPAPPPRQTPGPRAAVPFNPFEEEPAAKLERSKGPYGDFVFSLRDLNEDIDLDTDTKKKILFLHANLKKVSLYRVLGVPASATTAEIRKAFLERSREFHPDTYFRKRLGSYLERMEAIFQHVREANDVLMDEAKRSKYDREGKQFDPEEVAIVARRQIDELESEQRSRVRRDRLMHARGFARLTKAREEMAAGDEALANGNLKSALQAYQLAMDLDPRLDEARQKMTEARRVAAVQRADAAVEQAQRAESEGNVAGAVALLQSALDIDASNPRLHGLMAGIKFRGGLDLKEARTHARRAIDLGDRSGRMRLLHGEILLGLGEKKAAKAELKLAVELGETRAKELL